MEKKYRGKYMMDNHDIKKIREGGFGCIYYPSIPCIDETKKQQKTTAKYITKVYIKDSEHNREYELGTKIRENVIDFQYYFGPIVKECKVDMNMVDDKCGETKDKIMSYKIKYLGGNNWEELWEIWFKTLSKRAFELKTIDSLTYMLFSIQKLQSQCQIIHGDLKLNNVMYSEKHQVPIMVDFGLSYLMENAENLLQRGVKANEKIQSMERNLFRHLSMMPDTIDINMLMEFLRQFMKVSYYFNFTFEPTTTTETIPTKENPQEEIQEENQQKEIQEENQQKEIQEENQQKEIQEEQILENPQKEIQEENQQEETKEEIQEENPKEETKEEKNEKPQEENLEMFDRDQTRELYVIYENKIKQWLGENRTTIDKITLAKHVYNSHLLWDLYSLFLCVMEDSVELYNHYPNAKNRELLKPLIEQCRNFIFDIAKEQTNINTCIESLNKMRKFVE